MKAEVPQFEYVKYGIWPEMSFAQQMEMKQELSRVKRAYSNFKTEMHNESRSISQCTLNRTMSDLNIGDTQNRLTGIPEKTDASQRFIQRKEFETIVKERKRSKGPPFRPSGNTLKIDTSM